MKIEITVEELKELLKKTPVNQTDVNGNVENALEQLIRVQNY